MEQKLSDWAEKNNISYSKAWRWSKEGKLPVNSYKTPGGSIMVGEKPTLTSVASVEPSKPSNYEQVSASIVPKSVGYENNKFSTFHLGEASTKTRTNRAANTDPFLRFENINNSYIPFRYSNGAGMVNNSCLSMRDVLLLCYKAYCSFSIVRNVVNIMAYFCASKIYLTGGTKKSREFFTAYFKKIKLDSFTKQFFTQFWALSNVYIHRQLGELKKTDIDSLKKNFGISTAKAKIKVPVKFVTLCPMSVEVESASAYFTPAYRMLLSETDIGRLKNPNKNQQDQEIWDSLDEKTQKTILKGGTQVYITLDSKLLTVVTNNKMDWEGHALPITYTILDLLEWKTSLQRMDLALSKTVNHAVLLITHGSELKDGTFNYNQKITDTLTSIFQNESVGRVLIGDYSLKGEFLIPDIDKILNSSKYDSINRDLEEGLGHTLFSGGSSSGDKFSNTQSKLKVFIEKLRNAREVFLDEFLKDEIARIFDDLGFKGEYPTPVFEDIDLNDNSEFLRIITQLAQYGMLTPNETFEALNTNKFPSFEDSLEHQAEFRAQKDKGFYEPITGGPYTQEKISEKANQNAQNIAEVKSVTPVGRQPGTKVNQKSKTTTPIGTGSVDEAYSLTKIKDNLIIAAKLEDDITNKIKKLHKLKELKDNQKEIVAGIVNLIVADHEPTNWLSKVDEYIKTPTPQNQDRQNESLEIAYNHQVNDFIAGILLNSKK